MLEVLNQLPQERWRQADDFLAFIGIYEDKKREGALKKLLLKNHGFIKGKIGVEAGAGLGNITEFLLELGAKKVFAVEENEFCVKFLRRKFKGKRKVEVIHERIQDFKPPYKVDFLFQELYGSLLLDESLLCLERIKFEPTYVIPDSGCIVGEVLNLEEIGDPVIDKEILKLFKGLLITDLFPNYKFKPTFPIWRWEFKRGRRNYEIRYVLPHKRDLLILGMEIWHQGERIIGSKESSNWPLVFTPIDGREFNLRFEYQKGYTSVYFNWVR